MAIGSFQDDEVAKFFKEGRPPKNKGWRSLQGIVRRKLDILEYASALKDLASPPGNRLEGLSGRLEGWYSIRINDQWRIVFQWNGRPEKVQIVDYH